MNKGMYFFGIDLSGIYFLPSISTTTIDLIILVG